MVVSQKNGWGIWILALLFYVYQYALIPIPDAMLTELHVSEMSVWRTVFRQFSFLYFIASLLMYVPIGILLDRYGPKSIISGCIFLTVIGLFLMRFEYHWVCLVVGRLLIAIGSSAAILGTIQVIRFFFKEEHFIKLLSFSITIGFVVILFGPRYDAIGYKKIAEIFAFFGLALTMAVYFIFSKIDFVREEINVKILKNIFTNKKIILLCCFVGIMMKLAEIYAVKFLKESRYLSIIMLIGICCGAPVFNAIARKTRYYLESMMATGLGMMIAILSFYMLPLTTVNVGIGFFLCGVCISYQTCLVYKVSSYNTSGNSIATATAVCYVIMAVAGYLFSKVFHLLNG